MLIGAQHKPSSTDFGVGCSMILPTPDSKQPKLIQQTDMDTSHESDVSVNDDDGDEDFVLEEEDEEEEEEEDLVVAEKDESSRYIIIISVLCSNHDINFIAG